MENSTVPVPAKTPPTMKDVARESGYSLATVSKVINGLPTGGKSQAAVEEAIRKLGYHVNPYARALKSSRVHHIILIMPSLKHPFFAHLTDELIEALAKTGYTYQLMITNYDPEAEQKSFSMVHAHKADGIIALTYNPDLVIEDSVPIVSIDRHLGSSVPCVSSDNFQGGRLAAEKLMELGCRRLLFLQTSSGVPGEPDKRRDGFEYACTDHGIPFQTSLFHSDTTDAVFRRFLKKHICGKTLEFDGIFCSSDFLAGRTLRFLEENSIAVPEKVQVIGYDGIPDFFTSHYVCSTIRQPVREMAEGAVSLLMNFDSTPMKTDICLPVQYTPAGTTKDCLHRTL